MKSVIQRCLLISIVTGGSLLVDAQQITVTEVPVTPEKIGTVEYWPLVCKGGSSELMRMSVEAGTNITFFFHKSASAAGRHGENLKAGECSWVDRPMLADEPSEILVRATSANMTYRLGEGGWVLDQRVIFSPPYQTLQDGGTRFLYVNNRYHNLYPFASDRFDIPPNKVIFSVVSR